MNNQPAISSAGYSSGGGNAAHGPQAVSLNRKEENQSVINHHNQHKHSHSMFQKPVSATCEKVKANRYHTHGKDEPSVVIVSNKAHKK
jgi:hypothetical protein